MKRICSLVAVLVLVFGLIGCNSMDVSERDNPQSRKTTEKSESVIKVEDSIASIGEVVDTLNCINLITNARNFYDALSDEDKEMVSNYNVLESAEKQITDSLIASIDAIGEPGANSNYAAAVLVASADYEALSDHAKGLVTNQSKLAEARIIAEELLSATWFEDYYVDDFGDPTEESYLRGEFTGTFSNSATSGSALDVFVYCEKNMTAKDAMISFRMIEYQSNVADFWLYDEDEIKIKVKINGKEYEDFIDYIGYSTINDPNIYIQRNLNETFDPIIDALENGDEISCLITAYSRYSTTTYRFKMNSNGLKYIKHKWKK